MGFQVSGEHGPDFAWKICVMPRIMLKGLPVKIITELRENTHFELMRVVTALSCRVLHASFYTARTRQSVKQSASILS